MGFVRKLTGAQGQIDAMNANANAQIAAAKQTADAQVKAMNDAARAAADAQRLAGARQQAEAKASEVASRPLAVAEVALDPVQTESSIGSARRRRAQFGKNYSSGVNI